ncbi:MAG: hypothetical protein K9L85_03410 [Candidatus Peribacteraceae bacterium]|nr:hypothetical protein [Candidatus Peribacteraceae bacterium]
MKRILIIAAIFVAISLALILIEDFLNRPTPGVSFSGEITDPAELGDEAVLLE